MSLMESVILFNKTLDQRLSEFVSVLCCRQTSLSANEVADEWSYYAELTLEPAGWQAVWKVSRPTCKDLNIKFPSYVLVYVENVDFKELSALVSIISVQGSIVLPNKLQVPLKYLYPLKEQDNSVLNIDSTADCIDKLRFFYINIWYPWDLDEDDADWVGKHLEQRLNLYFEMMNKEKFPSKLADKIFNKIEKALKLYDRKKELEDILNEGEMNGKDFDTNILSPGIQSQGYELLKIHLELNPLLTEIQLLETPSMRTLMTSQFLSEEKKSTESSQIILVWQQGPLDMLETYVKNTKLIIGSTAVIRSASSLETAMEGASSGQIVLLHPGLHSFSGRVEGSVTIKGIGDNVYIKRDESCSYLLNIHANMVKLENISFDVRNVEVGIVVPKNTEVHLTHCKIFGQSLRETVGLIVLPGASVFIDQCQFTDLHTAIHCYGGARVTIAKSCIQNCRDGLKAHENVHLRVENSSLISCQNVGVVYSCKVENDLVGGIALLEKTRDILIKNVDMKNNRSDVKFQSLS